jgi:hypothetical protein
VSGESLHAGISRVLSCRALAGETLTRLSPFAGVANQRRNTKKKCPLQVLKLLPLGPR